MQEGNYWTRRRLSRRTFVRGTFVASAGLAGAALIGCGDDDDDGDATNVPDGTTTGTTPTTAPTGTPKRGGKIRVIHNSGQAFPFVDPARHGTQVAHFGNASILMNDHLMTFDWETKEVIPRLAQSVEVVDDLTYVVNLRQGVKFHDGETLTAEDVVFAMSRFNTDNEGSTVLIASKPQVFPAAEAIDEHTVRLKLEFPFPDMLSLLAGAQGVPVSKKAYSTASDPFGYSEGRITNPVTAGPFRVTDFRAREYITVGRFDEYWDGPKYLDTIENPVISEDASRVTQLITGEAHLIGNIPPQDLAELEKKSDILVDSRPGVKTQELFYNSLRPPFGQPQGAPTPQSRDFRKAMLMAIDRQALVDFIWDGKGDVADSFMHPVQFGYKPQVLDEYNPQRAKALLEQAGWDFNYVVKFPGTQGAFTADRAYIEAAVQMLRDIGVKINLEVIADYSSYVQMLTNREPDNLAKWDMTITNLTMSPDSAIRVRGILGPNDVLAHYDHPDLNAMLDKMLKTVDDEERAAQLDAIQKFVADEAAISGLTYQHYAIGWRKNLKGMKIAYEGWDLRDAWLDA